VFTPQPAVAWI